MHKTITNDFKLHQPTLERNAAFEAMTAQERQDFLQTKLDSLSVRTSFNDVALLDVKSLYVLATQCQNPELSELYRQEALRAQSLLGRQSSIAQMTYEDIILNNPKDAMRVFTSGEVAQSEASFYRGHQLIEDSLNSSIALMQDALHSGDASLLSEASTHVAEATGMMRQFMTGLNSDHFKAFKPYFDINPYTGEKGPSGAFTATIPHVDVLLYGQDVSENLLSYLNDNASYFPAKDYARMQDTLNGEQSLMKKFKDNPDALPHLQAIAQSMVLFRKIHMGTVVKHVGKDAVGSAEAGSAVPFLHDRIKQTVACAKTLKPSVMGA